jgi:hypothetical protein
MPSAPEAVPSDEVLESIREFLAEPDDEDLVAHREQVPDEELQQPLHNPFWAGGSGAGAI